MQLGSTQHLKMNGTIRSLHPYKLKKAFSQCPAKSVAKLAKEQWIRLSRLFVDIDRDDFQSDQNDFTFTCFLVVHQRITTRRRRHVFAPLEHCVYCPALAQLDRFQLVVKFFRYWQRAFLV